MVPPVVVVYTFSYPELSHSKGVISLRDPGVDASGGRPPHPSYQFRYTFALRASYCEGDLSQSTPEIRLIFAAARVCGRCRAGGTRGLIGRSIRRGCEPGTVGLRMVGTASNWVPDSLVTESDFWRCEPDYWRCTSQNGVVRERQSS